MENDKDIKELKNNESQKISGGWLLGNSRGNGNFIVITDNEYHILTNAAPANGYTLHTRLLTQSQRNALLAGGGVYERVATINLAGANQTTTANVTSIPGMGTAIAQGNVNVALTQGQINGIF